MNDGGGSCGAPAPLPAAFARVYVLMTGGTFGMRHDETQPARPLIPMAREALAAALPDAERLVPGVRVTLDWLEPLIDSASMQPQSWLDIARRIEKNYDTHDGFVVIHGTDSLAYTASALSFLLTNLSKPVIVTGAQYPLIVDKSDALANYSNALSIAGYKTTGLPCIPEVIVVFGAKILRGCRTRKMQVATTSCFDSPNARPLGELGAGRGGELGGEIRNRKGEEAGDKIRDKIRGKTRGKTGREIADGAGRGGEPAGEIRIYRDHVRLVNATAGETLKTIPGIDPNVLDISLHPGLGAVQLAHILALDGLKGVVLRAFGAGNMPMDPDFAATLAAGLRDKVAIAISQCPHGAVEMDRYAAGLRLLRAGVIPGGDMTPEAALCKLMVALGTGSVARARAAMSTDLCGEMSLPSGRGSI